MPRRFDIDTTPYFGSMQPEQMVLALEPVVSGEPEYVVYDTDVEIRMFRNGRTVTMHVGIVKLRVSESVPDGENPLQRRFGGLIDAIDTAVSEFSRIPSDPDAPEMPEATGLHAGDGIKGYLLLGRYPSAYFWKEQPINQGRTVVRMVQ